MTNIPSFYFSSHPAITNHRIAIASGDPAAHATTPTYPAASPQRGLQSGASHEHHAHHAVKCISRRSPTGPLDRAERPSSGAPRRGSHATGHRAIGLWIVYTNRIGPGHRGYVNTQGGHQQSSRHPVNPCLPPYSRKTQDCD